MFRNEKLNPARTLSRTVHLRTCLLVLPLQGEVFQNNFVQFYPNIPNTEDLCLWTVCIFHTTGCMQLHFDLSGNKIFFHKNIIKLEFTLIEISRSHKKFSKGCENGGSLLMLGWFLVYVLNTLAASSSFLRHKYWRTVWPMKRSSSDW